MSLSDKIPSRLAMEIDANKLKATHKTGEEKNQTHILSLRKFNWLDSYEIVLLQLLF